MSPNLHKSFFSPSAAAPAAEFNKRIDAENGRRSRALRSKSRAVWPFPVMTRR